mmetsp:Transcript_59604/g.129375  ORF Transcript_59604/g.129375 Transcript_59604/m.129375 type:complete len:112 (-) Transcript_59604:741-1076(-)|eukprot:CAMPEP_0116908886 /NCGR_PEP_ID=MMETSP0467-20121206/13947_1 /TAXON_ID=283647 /ORGANISM="Mesodinium pulex, Strain SPMC105" /LENGTH=111 /DNA_ID=CAMNT_0004584139 /DNA_START=1057 /DNA_END=1392 /DNA_ORIENTATION=-
MSTHLSKALRAFSQSLETYSLLEMDTPETKHKEVLNKNSFVQLNEFLSVLLEKHFHEVLNESKKLIEFNKKNLDGTLEKLELRKNRVKEVKRLGKKSSEIKVRNKPEEHDE